jgi:NADPH-dependent 2,4-dienoyl-CoA reductase/sulfur reductase-like enzyme
MQQSAVRAEETVAMLRAVGEDPGPKRIKMAQPRIIIVGGGFGGLAAAKPLRKARAEIILIGRKSHHLFQRLLYQVATSVLAPAQLAFRFAGF